MSANTLSRRDFLHAAMCSSAACVRLSCSALTVSALFVAAGKTMAETLDTEISTINVLNPDEAADLAAIAARIIPSDETPGAKKPVPFISSITSLAAVAVNCWHQ